MYVLYIYQNVPKYQKLTWQLFFVNSKRVTCIYAFYNFLIAWNYTVGRENLLNNGFFEIQFYYKLIYIYVYCGC